MWGFVADLCVRELSKWMFQLETIKPPMASYYTVGLALQSYAGHHIEKGDLLPY